VKITQAKRPIKRVPIYHGWRRVLYSPPVVVLMLVLVVLLGRSVFRVYIKWDRSRASVSDARARYEAEVRRQASLEESVARLKTERGYDAEVRQNFGLGKPGEGVIIIVDKDATSSSQ
jgi:cell division protein FtsB